MRLRVARVVLLTVAVGTVLWVNAGDLMPPPGAVMPTNRTQLNAQAITLPFTISSAGGYVLTSNFLGSSGNDGIVIDADNVTLDLNGFALGGGGAAGDGIVVSGTHRNIKIHNGSIDGWGGAGIKAIASVNSRFEDLRISNNGGAGISLGNNGWAIGHEHNGNLIGIEVVGDGNRIEANHLTDNGRGIAVSGANNIIIKNTAAGSTGVGVPSADYDIAAGNSYGPIANVGGVGDMTPIGESHHPWANFSLTCIVAAELCDLLDNDCDGDINEDFPNLGAACSVGVGVCQADGTFVCAGDGLTTECSAVPGDPQEEICDGLDNNCNGLIDEEGGALWCRDADNDGFGDPADMVTDCTQPEGYVADCSDCDDTDPGSNPQAVEVCDGIDNNCDQNIDEGNPGGGQSCNTGLPGVCAAGTTQCTGGQIVCVQDNPPSGEVCNNLDDDCDGIVDEGDICPGGQICQSGACQCPAGTQNCAGECVDTNTDPANCGFCGNQCPGGEICSAGACVTP